MAPIDNEDGAVVCWDLGRVWLATADCEGAIGCVPDDNLAALVPEMVWCAYAACDDTLLSVALAACAEFVGPA